MCKVRIYTSGITIRILPKDTVIFQRISSKLVSRFYKWEGFFGGRFLIIYIHIHSYRVAYILLIYVSNCFHGTET